MSKHIIQEIKLGDKFGNWVVVDGTVRRKNGRSAHLCECSCAKKTRKVILDKDLKNGKSGSCGCRRGNGGCNRKVIQPGTIFGFWTVVEASSERSKKGGILYLCQCRCGTRKLVFGGNLRTGTSKSCGCLTANTKVFVGAVFTRWTVIASTDEVSKHGSPLWVCQCACDKQTVRKVSTHQLTRATKNSRSCGCITTEAVAKACTTHGKSGTKEYRREYYKKDRELYPEKYRLYYASHRARKADALPEWAKEHTKDVFKSLVIIARKTEQQTGEKYHVDHIVPLNGRANGERVVCGLHVWYNLQLLPEAENLSKNCHRWPDMWEY